jgi:hypothetical protein
MGVINVTPDSFSDGGLFLDAQDAVAHGERLDHPGGGIRAQVGPGRPAPGRGGAAAARPAGRRRTVHPPGAEAGVVSPHRPTSALKPKGAKGKKNGKCERDDRRISAAGTPGP